jgi:PhzF family phenazine biosynthesis protein
MKISRAFKQVDVFTAVALRGNPVAVVLDGTSLSTEEMQQFALWTNLSETTFLLPPSAAGADYHLRIFTPNFELPFAGHPTLGSAHAALEAGLATPKGGKIVQQCGVGLIEISVPDDWRSAGLSFRLPQHTLTPAPDPLSLIAAMGSGVAVSGMPIVVDVGPRWVIAQISTAANLSALKPNLVALADYDRAHATTGLTVFAETAEGISVRSFAPLDGIAEDPVCGSGNGAVAAYRLEMGAVSMGSSYSASQGREIGRDGIIRIRYADGAIHVGGNCVTCIEGLLSL